MKNISIVLLIVLMLVISTGCTKFLSDEEITNIYYENKELINRIKDGFFSSGFIPDGLNEVSGITLRYDYENGRLFCNDDPQDEKLQRVQNVHSDAIEYFTRMNKNHNPSIGFRKFRFMEDSVIEFFFSKNVNLRVLVIYTTEPDKYMFGGLVHIEDNWYTQRHRFTE